MNADFFILNKMCRACFVMILIATLIAGNSALAAGETLDPTFGSGGIVVTDLGGSSDTGINIVLQPDGKIIMAGSSGSASILVRYNSDGTLDNTFGTSGKLTAGLRAPARIALQTDGKLVLGGSMNSGLALARYTSNGTLDNAFGTNGVATTGPDGNFTLVFGDLAIQSDGKIVVVGTQQTGGHNYPAVIARFNANGTLDEDFRIKFFDGTDFPGSLQHYPRAVALQTDGKIIMTGDMISGEGEVNITLGRVTTGSDPWLDPTFGTNGQGTVVTPLANFTHGRGALAIQANSKIVIAGTTYSDDNNINENLTLARYNSNGTLDTTLGGSGIVITDLSKNEAGNDLVIQTDGKIIVAGKSYSGTASDFLLVRYDTNGSLDTTFGDAGKIISDLGGSDSALGTALQLDGKILAVGAKDGDAVLARYSVSTTPPPGRAASFKSKGSLDGWILGKAESSNAGGSLNKTATTFNVGDDPRDKQYRSIISFNTSALPDNAIVTSAQVSIKRQGLMGTDPFATHGSLLLEIRNGPFNSDLDLKLGDFGAPPSSSIPESFIPTTFSWYTANLSSSNLRFVNKYGVTQFRLRFSKDDNDDRSADYIKFFSGEAPDANQPKLIVTYTVPQ